MNLKDANNLFLEGQIALAQIEANGIAINEKFLDFAIKKVSENISTLEKKLYQDEVWTVWTKLYGDKTKINSRQQFGKVLFEEMKVKYPSREKTKTGRFITNETVMSQVDIPFVRRFLKIQGLKKLKATYLLRLKEGTIDGFYHPEHHLNTVTTYRSSADGIQTIPKRDEKARTIIRKCFVPRSGHYLVATDYGSHEFRGAAMFWKDKAMMEYASNPKLDIHRDMAAKMFLCKPEQVNSDLRYCNPPDCPIWMADYSFKLLGDIKVGDTVIGWRGDKNRVRKGGHGGIKNRKRFVRATVTAIHRKQSDIVKVTMESGRVFRCSPDHFWYLYKKCVWTPQGTEYDITNPKVGRNIAFIVQPTPPISKELERDASWLGGLYDGEGHWPGISQSWGHNPQICRAMEKTAKKLGFKYAWHHDNSPNRGSVLSFKGGIDTDTKFLNWCRPVRRKHITKWLTRRSSFFKKDKIVKVEPDGFGDVIGLTTTTGNYVAWGYASKNCGKNGWVFPRLYGSYYIKIAQAVWPEIEGKFVGDVPLKTWLKLKGIHERGLCDKDVFPPEKKTFEHHLLQVQKGFDQMFPTWATGRDEWYNLYRKRGWFRHPTGFVQRGLYSRNDLMNHPIQGSLFHCLVWSLIRLVRKELKEHNLKTKILAEIHDEILADVPKDELQDYLNLVERVMTVDIRKEWKWLTVPLLMEAKCSDVSWADMQTMEKKEGTWSRKIG